MPHIAYAAIVGAGVASAKLVGLDTDTRPRPPTACWHPHAREHAEGGGAAAPAAVAGRPARSGRKLFPMQDNVIHYAGQPVAVVIADSHERAQYAASLVRATY